MLEKDLVGVILAGGKGTRMQPFSTKYPKPILPILNRPLMVHQIEQMVNVGINKIYIVIGHLGFEIAKTLGDGEKFGVELNYVDQSETLGIAHALGKLEPYIKSPFMLFLGDIYFSTNNLIEMVELFYKSNLNSVLAVKEDENEEAIKRNFAVILNEESTYVRRVIEKPRYVSNTIKGCGLYLFDLNIFDAIRRTPRTAMRDEYEITEAIQILIDHECKVGISDVILEDLNLTYPVDLWRCNLKQLKRLGRDKLVSKSSIISSNSKIINSVIGENVTVKKPITIKDSVVFDNTIIDNDLFRTIKTPSIQVDIPPSLKDFNIN